MKNKILSIAIFLIVTLIAFFYAKKSFNSSNIIRDYRPDGTLEMIATPKKDGIICFQFFYENGNMKSKFCTKNEKKEGWYEAYYKNGVRSEKVHYKNGMLDGEAFFYYDNGELEHKNLFKKGNKSGYQYSYNKQGKIKVVNFSADDTTFYIKQIEFDKDGNQIGYRESFKPRITIESDTSLEVGEYLVFSVEAPLPDSLIKSKSLYFFYDMTPNDGSNSHLKNYPKISYLLENNKEHTKKTELLKSGDLIFYGLIGTKDSTGTVFYDPPFTQRIKVVDKK